MRHDPYKNLPETPSFRVTSPEALDGKAMPRHIASEGAGGDNTSLGHAGARRDDADVRDPGARPGGSGGL